MYEQSTSFSGALENISWTLEALLLTYFKLLKLRDDLFYPMEEHQGAIACAGRIQI